MLEAFELAHGEIIRICDAIDELAREVGKPKWIDVELNAELADRHGDAVGGADRRGRPPRGRRDRRGAPRRERPRDHDGLERGGHRPRDAGPERPQALLESQRLAAVEKAVREQFEDELRALTDAEQDSKELKSRKREILVERIQEDCTCRSPVGDGEDAPSRTPSPGRTSRRRPTRSTRTSSARRSPSTSAGPTGAARRRSGRSRPRSTSRRGRTAPRSSRAGRRRS